MSMPFHAHHFVPNPYLEGNFAPVREETTAFELKVRGRIPRDLNGGLFRIGPNPAGEVDPATYHWFTGTGMVHGLRLSDGRAEWYRSRYTINAGDAKAIGRGDIPGPSNGGGSVNTNVTRIAGRTYALVEAGSLPIELNDELDSVARSDFGGTLEGGFAAHPKRDPMTGETLAITYEPRRAALRYVVVDPAGRARTVAEIAAPHKPMVHDVAFTNRFVVILDLPVTFQPERAQGSIFPYIWNERTPSRVGLLPRDGDLKGLRWFEAPRCFVFHVLNAFDDESGNVVMDVVRHPSSFNTERRGPDEGRPVLVRWRLDRYTGALTESMLSDIGCEFPRFDDRLGGQAYRFGYSVRWNNGTSFGPLLQHDLKTERTLVHDVGTGNAALEPIFVPRAGGTDEDDGYILAYVYEVQRNAGAVIILSAKDFTGHELARIELPARVPFGFHGSWIPDQG